MKILWSFDTKLDEHELYDAIKKCWQWNAIMMKKHWAFLTRAIVRMICALLAFCALVWVAYFQFFEKNTLLFRILSILYFLVTFMWCIHSLLMIRYDIKQQNKIKIWYIDTIRDADLKEWKYERFLKHTIISAIWQFILLIWNVVISFKFWFGGMNIWLAILWLFVNILFLFLLYRVLYSIIDYEMDFNIFTVDQFIIYRQHWFLKTESMNIATSTVKIVQESKSWFWWSLFRYGKVSIHPEWSLWENKSIELFYVPNPKPLTKKLNEFIEKSKEGTNIAINS